MTLAELKEKVGGNYSKGDAALLEKTEQRFVFSEFGSEDALKIGNKMVQCAVKYGEEAAIQIIRFQDELPVFQYVGNTCSLRNLDFVKQKIETVKRTGHCSHWAMAREVWYQDVSAVFEEGSGCLPVEGAFPIYVGKELTAVIGVSGLHHGKDYAIIYEALCDYFGISEDYFVMEREVK